jgi:hypothetical protein
MNTQFLIHNEIIIANVASCIRNNWQAMKAKDEVLEVVLRPYKSSRNLEQNKRLHAMLQEIANQAWVNGRQYPMEVWKESFKRDYLSVVELPNGMLTANPTHKLNIKECAEFMQKIEAYAVSELGVVFDR